jgi:hypothetical protein
MGACFLITLNKTHYCADQCDGAFLAVWRFFAQPGGTALAVGCKARRIAPAISMRLDDSLPGAGRRARFREVQFTGDGLVLGDATVLAKM